jgi:hypothetical protein
MDNDTREVFLKLYERDGLDKVVEARVNIMTHYAIEHRPEAYKKFKKDQLRIDGVIIKPTSFSRESLMMEIDLLERIKHISFNEFTSLKPVLMGTDDSGFNLNSLKEKYQALYQLNITPQSTIPLIHSIVDVGFKNPSSLLRNLSVWLKENTTDNSEKMKIFEDIPDSRFLCWATQRNNLKNVCEQDAEIAYCMSTKRSSGKDLTNTQHDRNHTKNIVIELPRDSSKILNSLVPFSEKAPTHPDYSQPASVEMTFYCQN